LARLESAQFGDEHIKPGGPITGYNQVFHAALDEVWSQTAIP
jgi:hypothetical protein